MATGVRPGKLFNRDINIAKHARLTANDKVIIDGDGNLSPTSLLLLSSQSTRTGAGAIDVTNAITWVVTTAADALTLAAGTEGQIKIIIMKTDGGDGTITPTNFAQGTTITMNDAGDAVIMVYTNNKWYVVGNVGCTIA